MPDTNFCITFTTIPSRIKTLKKTIESIEKQTLKPNKIFLNIPYKYHRFPNTKILDSDLKNLKSELLEVSRCDDFGPATKIMGSLKKVKTFLQLVFFCFKTITIQLNTRREFMRKFQ